MNNYAKLSIKVILTCLSIAILYSCSSQKDNATNRSLQNLSARYNYIYNSNVLLTTYQEELSQSYKDNYDNFLAIYIAPSSIDYLNPAATAKELESITNKAQTIVAEKSLSNYLDQAYLLLGKTNFYKGNYFNAVAYFDYTAKAYQTDKKILLTALNWKARSLIQLNDYVAADKILDTIKIYLDSVKSEKAEPLATLAQMSIYKNDLNQAINYLEQAIKQTSKIQSRTRWPYILAQLYEHNKQYDASLRNYTKVENSNAPFEMYFNAKLSKIRIHDFLNDQSSDRKDQLLKLIKDDKNLDYTDQIYYEVAQDYYADRDLQKAEEYYKLSAQRSTGNLYQKGLSYLKIANLNFEDLKDYVHAKLYYDSAINTLPKNYHNYESIVRKGQNLEYLTHRYQLISAQDTLQFIAGLTEQDREKKLALMFEQKKEPIVENATDKNGKLLNNNLSQSLRNENNGTFYFNNVAAISKGFTDFKKRWGNRVLEENWRQSVKSSSQLNLQNQSATIGSNTAATNSIQNATDLDKASLINAYKALLPFTPEQKLKSDQQIIDAYFEIAGFYQQVLADQEEAIKIYEILLNRYPQNNHLEAIYYSLHIGYKNIDDTKANSYKNLVLSNYPNSVFAKTILDPNFSVKQNALELEIHKIYNTIFDIYQNKEFTTVITNVNETNQRFPGNSLQAQYDYLKSIAIGRTQDIDSLLSAFKDILVRYPKDQLIAPLVQDHITYINANLASFKTRTIALIDFDPNEPPFGRPQIDHQILKQTPALVVKATADKPIVPIPVKATNSSGTVTPPEAIPSVITQPTIEKPVTTPLQTESKAELKTEPIKPVVDHFFSLTESKPYYYVINVEDVTVSLSSSRFGIGQFNRGNYAGNNLKHQLSEFNENQLIYVGNFDNIEEVKAYYEEITSQLTKIMKVPANSYKDFYISKENFDKLKNKETIHRYLEFFKNNF